MTDDGPTDGSGTEDGEALRTVRTDTVRFAETDAQGVVFYGAYVTWLDEALNAYLRAIDYDYDRMHEEGWTTHVAHVDLDYAAPAAYGDEIDHRFAVTEIGEASIETAYAAHDAATGDRLASGSAVYVAVDRESGDARRVPDTFRNACGVAGDE